jgi:dihydrofolate reductase
MGKVVLRASMSLDGFMTGPDVGTEHPMGRGGERLHEWLFDESDQGRQDAEIAREASAAVGSVVIGRRTFDLGLEPWGDVPFPVPCFVLTRESRDDLPMASGTFTFVDGSLPSALEHAQAAAGERDVLLMGASVGQQFLDVGLVDEIEIQLVPVLLGAGTRLFDHLGPEHIELERTEAIESPHVTHLRFRVVR